MARHTDESIASRGPWVARQPASPWIRPELKTAIGVLVIRHPEWRRTLCEGCRGLAAFLRQIPCLAGVHVSGSELGYWRVDFEINQASPIAWCVIRQLAIHLNSPSARGMMPTVFRPIPSLYTGDPLRWEIASTATGVDPAGVERWLRGQLPPNPGEQRAWEELE